MFNIREITSDLLQKKIELIDLPEDQFFLEEINRVLMKVAAQSEELNIPVSIPRIASLRAELINKIAEIQKRNHSHFEEE